WGDSTAHSAIRLCRRACSGGGMEWKFSDSASHLRLWASPSVRQVVASGASDCCCCGVSSVQAGCDSGRGAGAVRTGAGRIASLLETEGLADWATAADAGWLTAGGWTSAAEA